MRLRRMDVATSELAYPRSETTFRTRSLVAAATPSRPLITFETVATDTPAARATSVIVVRARGRILLVVMILLR